jgi:HSP20 family protein
MSSTAVIHRPSTSRSRTPLPSLMSWLDSLWASDLELPRSLHEIRVEEFFRNGDFIVRAEVPGIDPDSDLQVFVANGVLTIEATREERTEEDQRSEFHYGHFRRSVLLPGGVTEDAVTASYADGIVEVTLHLPEESEQPRSIPVARAS